MFATPPPYHATPPAVMSPLGQREVHTAQLTHADRVIRQPCRCKTTKVCAIPACLLYREVRGRGVRG